ncbi:MULTISPECIES: hypothetical protein [unclassified Tatumella]|nr:MULTISPECIES: hypothetical protein [unclassified Tatumella]MBS0856260.1 hypothetical protein [Tatumella sp. JGM16]MBS0913431.1 hypothetical protein [Tatumella sp. JGM91]
MWRNDGDFIAEMKELIGEEIEAIQQEQIDLATERQNPVISWQEFEGNFS